MIPVSLTLKNFLSYGEEAPTLDFSKFQIACVTGRNGHGKSALFDAITWALWGEARKASSDRKPDEGLLRIGATDLRVEFVFDLEGQRFRVSRSYRKTARSGSSSLELQVFDASVDRYRAISESSSIRKTQAALDRLVRISYDTFVNSAFIIEAPIGASSMPHFTRPQMPQPSRLSHSRHHRDDLMRMHDISCETRRRRPQGVKGVRDATHS